MSMAKEMGEVEGLAAELAARQQEEECALMCLLEKTGKLNFSIPAAVQWKYDYSKTEYTETKWGKKAREKTGVATARFCEIQSIFSVNKRVIDVRFGPTATFISMNITYRDLRKKMGGLLPILAAIKESLAMSNKVMQEEKEQTMAELKTISKD